MRVYLLMDLLGQLQYTEMVDSGGFELFLRGKWPYGYQYLFRKIIGLLVIFVSLEYPHSYK